MNPTTTGPAGTITAAFSQTVARQADDVALRSGSGAERISMTWAEYAEAASRVAGALRSLGLRRGDRVALMVRNRPEFWVADMGVLLAGGTPVSIYNSSPPDRIAFVAGHAEARIAVVEDLFLDRFAGARVQAPDVEQVVSVGPGGDLTLDDLLGSAALDLGQAAAEVRPDDLVTVIYTSGTTGDPKGVMLSHANVTFAADVYRRVLGRSLQGLRQVSCLPMAHIGERTATHYFHTTQGSVVHCCPDLTGLPALLAEVQPDWFFSAPRFWEKLQAGIQAKVEQDAAGAEAFARARALGWQVFVGQWDGVPLPEGLEDEWKRARRDHIEPVLERVGFGNVSVAITGAAPTPRHLSEYILSLGIPFSEVWGMSETSGTGTWSPHRIVPGTAGRPVPGVEIRLGAADEILVRGPCVFQGYLKDPVRTSETIDTDGWLHTGDIGHFDNEGNLTVVDRLKEIIVPSSGHNVSPAQIEAQLKSSALIGQACVVGSGRPHLAALLVLDPDAVASWSRGRDLDGMPAAGLAEHPALRREIADFVAGVNDTLPPAERVRGFAIVADEWLPDSDVLTPTSKLKRRSIEARYETVINRLYDGRGTQ